jgi:hypothetical protein
MQKACRIWDSHSSQYYGHYLPDCYAVLSGTAYASEDHIAYIIKAEE